MKRCLSFLTLALLLAGCGGLIPAAQTDPTRYFVLTGPPPAPAAAAGTLRLGLHRVDLAAYLKSPDLIVRQGTNELFLQDYARWGEPLDAGIARLLQERLQAAGGVGRVYLQPFPLDTDRDYDVTVTVLRCEGAVGGESGRGSRFAATFEITKPGDGRLIARRTFVAPDARWDGKNFAELAGLLSADVAALGQEVIGALPTAPAAGAP
jgi:uncharacterized lipoprotein YmbA